MSDDEVIERVLGGDTEAFRMLVERYERAVFRIVSSLVARDDRAEDIAQDVFLAAYIALGDFDKERGRFSTWLYAMAKNRCLNVRKKRAPLLLAVVPETCAQADPLADLVQKRAIARLDGALEALPEEQRTAFVMREIADLSTDEIAEIEKVDPATIRSRVSRAKARLRAALDEGDAT
jgi:RNA polymerase sigma-70 factor, ECF subfamily